MKKRIMGIETEYGLAFQRKGGGFSSFSADTAASFLRFFWKRRNQDFLRLNLYRAEHLTIWIGSNGGKFYEDIGHVEYSSPECSSAKEVLLYNLAGDAMAASVAESFYQSRVFRKLFPAYKDILLTKNNSDFLRPVEDPLDGNPDHSGAVHFFGSHENYLTHRNFAVGETDSFKNPSEFFTEAFSPFLVSRVVLHGSGGMWYFSEKGWQYVLSTRALATQSFHGYSATGNRPLIQFAEIMRHKPVVSCFNAKVRMHLIFADSNLSHYSSFLRFGTTHLVLRVIEELGSKVSYQRLKNPIEALHLFSRDISLKARARLLSRGSISALEIQKHYIDLVSKLKLSEEEKEIFDYWISVVTRLEKSPENLGQELDWAIKYSVLRNSMQKHSYDFQSDKARILDIRYSDLSENGIFNILKKAGRVKVLFSDEEIKNAVLHPPPTRAKIRSDYIRAIVKVKQGCPLFDNLAVDWETFHKNPELIFVDPLRSKSRRLEKFLEKISKN